MRGDELLEWLAELPAAARDQALEEYLGIATPEHAAAPLGPELIGYHPSGVAAIVRALAEAPVGREDVLVDLGAGLGKVLLLAHLLTSAATRGIEIQAELVTRARAAAARLGLPERVHFEHGDARTCDLEPGTVFYLYAPFTGNALSTVLARLERVATARAIVVCALGVDLHRFAPWLVPRPSDAFWLTVYDRVVGGAFPRMKAHSTLSRRLTDIVARER